MSLKLNKIKEAPRDGSKIVIFWKTPNDDYTEFNVREAYYEDFEYLGEHAEGISQEWKYVSDRDFILTIYETDIIGWLPCPDCGKKFTVSVEDE